MEEKEVTGNNDNPEIVLPSTDFPESAEKKPALKQRLAETFREGVASTRSGGDKRPEVKITPTPGKKLQEPIDRKVKASDRVIAEGGSAAAAVRDKVAGAGDAFVQLIKKTPDLTRKYADAFREGAASVRSSEGKEKREVSPAMAKKKAAPVDGKEMLDAVHKAGESAVVLVRKAFAAVNLGEFSPAGLKIRICRKKINSLYIDIGSEAVNSWQGGIMETEKMTALLNELQKNEEEIISLQPRQAEVPQARKKQTARSPQAVKKEAGFTPAAETPESSSVPVQAVSVEAAPQKEESVGVDVVEGGNPQI